MQANLQWLDDPEVFRVNQLPAHSDHHYYRDLDEIRTGSSSFIKSLTVLGVFTLRPPRLNVRSIFIHLILIVLILIRSKYQGISN